MYAKSTRPSAKREVQKERSAKRDVQKFRSAQRDDRVLRSAKRDDRIARPRRAQTCERSELRAKRAMRMCPRSGQIFFSVIGSSFPLICYKKKEVQFFCFRSMVNVVINRTLLDLAPMTTDEQLSWAAIL